MTGLLAEGYDCKKCGEHHKFGSWIYAHWDEEVSHTCLACGTEHIIIHGVADRVLHKATM